MGLSQKTFQTKMDSIWQNNRGNFKDAICQSFELCKKHTRDTLSYQMVYNIRKHQSKDDLRAYLNTLDELNISSNYIESLRYYVENNQLKKGDNCTDFTAIDQHGYQISLSSLTKQKDILLIFGGLQCMGEEAFLELKNTHTRCDTSKIEIVSFVLAEDIDHMKSEIVKFQVPWAVIANFKMDHSPTKIMYDVQATPKVFQIKKGGIIIEATDGLPESAFKFISK